MAEWVQTISGDIIPVSGITYIGCDTHMCRDQSADYICAICNDAVFELFDIPSLFTNSKEERFKRVDGWAYELTYILLDEILHQDEKIFRCNEHEEQVFNRMVEVLELDG